MNDRLACCVPFCRRTTRAGRFTEWLCREHWRLIDDKRRRAFQRVSRRWRRHRREQDAEIGLVLWSNIKRQAIERAAGIV